MSTPRTISGSRLESGVTLVELMVALLLGLVLTGGAIQIFSANRVTYAFNEGLSRLQENGRFALDTLNFRVRMAGFMGCLSGVTVFNNLNSPTSLAFNFAEGLRGFEAEGTSPGETFTATAVNPNNSTNTGDWSPGLAAELSGRVVPGSDVIVVRNVSARAHALASPFNNATEVTVVADPADYVPGDIAVVSDCQKASIFQVTGVAGAASPITLTHTAAGAPGNQTFSWGTDQEYAAGAELLRGETWVYYVGAPAAGEPPALFQRRLNVATASTSAAMVDEQLVEGVDTMQVLYGVDAAMDGTVDVPYVTAENVVDWDEVVAVRIALLMRAPEEYGPERDTQTYDVNEMRFNPVDDRRLRQVFTTTIAVRNRLP